MAVARGMMRSLVLLMLALVPPGLAFAQSDIEQLRYRFEPPLDTDIVQSVEVVSALGTPTLEHVERWTHEVVIRLDTFEADEFNGTFQLRNVVNVENAQDDLYYLIAKAVEGQTYSLRMLDFGMVSEVDWTAIRARIEARLPSLTDPANADMIKAALPLFDDPTKAVLRPIDIAGLAYVLPFRTDGELNERQDLGKLTYFGLDPVTVQIAGGFDPEVDSYILDWLVNVDSALAGTALASQLRSLAATMDSQGSAEIIEDAIAQGIVAAEDGYVLYDLDEGLLREAKITALISSDPVAYGIRISVSRQSP